MGDEDPLEDGGQDASGSWAELWGGKESQPRGFSACATRGSDLPRGRAVPDIASRALVQLGIYPNISWELWEGEKGELQQAPSAFSFPRVGDFGSEP